MSARAGGGAYLRRYWDQYASSIYIRQLKQIGPLGFWQVQGKVIRDHVFIDFTEGGNSNAYQWLPPFTIVLDTDVAPAEFWCVGLHEFHEYNRMAEGLGYERAHDSANRVELKARHSPPLLKPLFAVEAAKFTDRLKAGKTVDLNARKPK